MKVWEKVICNSDQGITEKEGKEWVPSSSKQNVDRKKEKKLKKKKGNLDSTSKQHQPEGKPVSEKDGYKASSGSLKYMSVPQTQQRLFKGTEKGYRNRDTGFPRSYRCDPLARTRPSIPTAMQDTKDCSTVSGLGDLHL